MKLPIYILHEKTDPDEPSHNVLFSAYTEDSLFSNKILKDETEALLMRVG